MFSCCCKNPPIPNIKINVNSNCCRGNRKYTINIQDVDDFEKINEVLQELHRNSLKKQQSSSSN